MHTVSYAGVPYPHSGDMLSPELCVWTHPHAFVRRSGCRLNLFRIRTLYCVGLHVLSSWVSSWASSVIPSVALPWRLEHGMPSGGIPTHIWGLYVFGHLLTHIEVFSTYSIYKECSLAVQCTSLVLKKLVHVWGHAQTTLTGTLTGHWCGVCLSWQILTPVQGRWTFQIFAKSKWSSRFSSSLWQCPIATHLPESSLGTPDLHWTCAHRCQYTQIITKVFSFLKLYNIGK